MIKIFCVCGLGMGTSMMAKMSVDKLCREVGLEAKVEAIDAGSVKGQKADLVVTTGGIARALGQLKIDEMVVIDNFVDKKKLREELIPVLERLKQK